MRTRIGCLCIVVWMSLWATASYGDGTVTSSSTVDSDGNGIEDRYETGLATKFVPAMVLDDSRTEQDTTSTSQDTSEAASRYPRFYAGLQTGVLLIFPFVGVTAGWQPADFSTMAIVADAVVGSGNEKISPWYRVGLVRSRHKSRGAYFRLGLSHFPNERSPYSTELGAGLRMNVSLSESLSLHPEVEIVLFVELEPDKYYDSYNAFPLLYLRVKMVVDL